MHTGGWALVRKNCLLDKHKFFALVVLESWKARGVGGRIIGCGFAIILSVQYPNSSAEADLTSFFLCISSCSMFMSHTFLCYPVVVF